VAINSGWLAVPVQPSAAGVETVGHCNSHIHSGMNNNASDTSHTCSAQLVQGPTNSPYQQELNSQLQHSHAAQQQQQQQQNMDGHHPQEGQQQDQDQVENDSQQQTSFIPCSPNMFHRNLPSLPQQQQQQQGQQQPEQEPELQQTYCEQQQQLGCGERTSDSGEDALSLAPSPQQPHVALLAQESTGSLPLPLVSSTGGRHVSSSNSCGKGNLRNVGGWLRSSGNNLPPVEAQTWLILEYCDGGTLMDLLQQGRLLSRTTGQVDLVGPVSRLLVL
jgi:hypothetical protein